MALVAKMVASSVTGRSGGRYVPCAEGDEGAVTLESYAGSLSGGAPDWLRGVEFVRYDPRGKGSEDVELSAVHAGKEGGPNKKWAVATPAGHLTMTIQNPEAFGYIEPGVEYYVEIRRARK